MLSTEKGAAPLQLPQVVMWHYKMHPDVALEAQCFLRQPIIIKILIIANLGFCTVLRSQEIHFQIIRRAEWKTGQ